MDEDAAWSLLRAANVWFAAAILPAHLTATAPRVEATILFDRIDADLDALREDGLDIRGDAQHHCTAWRRSGVLLRRAVAASREEMYELTPAALHAFAFIEALEGSRTSISHSRLATVQDRVRTIVRETDPDVEARIAALQEQKARIDEQIRSLESGEMPPADDAQARDDVQDLLSLVAAIPDDFTRVRMEIETINRELRESLITSDGERGRVLGDVFRGVDHVAESEAGRSFAGFYSLILDPESSAELEDNIDTLLSRDFVSSLAREEKRFLRTLMPLMQTRAQEVEQIMTGLTRSLRRFVQSQEFREERILNEEISRATAKAVETARAAQPFHDSGFALPQSSFTVSSVGGWRLHDPGESRVDDALVSRPPEAPVDWNALVTESRSADIDMEELIEAVAAVMAAGRSSPSVADVLRDHPATQGIASVVGLLALSTQYGYEEPADAEGEVPTERVEWETGDGVKRSADVPQRRFDTSPAAVGRRVRRVTSGGHHGNGPDGAEVRPRNESGKPS
jgi:hypothetical protein